MSVELTLRAVEIFRSFGVPVTFEPGWDRRGNGQSSAYQGGIEHHTGGAYNNTCPAILIQGRSDLAGPLCNFAGLSGGGIHVVAAHPANHAGASGGPSNGPFPRTTLFNRLVMGLEICYPGNSPMTDAQYRTAKVFAYAMKVLFGDIERNRGHAETSIEGKWDPGYSPGRTINMSALRADALNLQEGEDDMTPDELLNATVRVEGDVVNAGKDISLRTIFAWSDNNFADLGKRIDAVDAKVSQGGAAIDYDTLAAKVADRVGDAVADKVADRLAKRLES